VEDRGRGGPPHIPGPGGSRGPRPGMSPPDGPPQQAPSSRQRDDAKRPDSSRDRDQRPSRSKTDSEKA
jgi:hypothetical protein